MLSFTRCYHASSLTCSSWSLIMHWALAFTNACNGLTYVTRFSCDIFGFYVACIYLQKGIQVLTRQWGQVGETSAYLSIMVALLVLMAAWICGELGNSNLFQRFVRKFLEDYGTPLTIVFFTGFVHIGHMRDVDVSTLPTSKSFFPTLDRPWLVHFWNIDVGDIFLAIPFALLLTILFYFDHNGMFIRLVFICLIVDTPSSLVSHGPRHGVPSSEASWLPLGPLASRSHDLCWRSSRNSLSQRPYPTGTFPHFCTVRHPSGGRRGRYQQG